jgi:hypothetical protein
MDRGLRARAHRLVVLITALTAACAASIPTAGAVEAGEVDLVLSRQPAGHADDSPLGIALTIANGTESSLDGFRVQVIRYERVTSRSTLHESFDGGSGAINAFSKDFSVEVAAGERSRVRLDQGVEKLFPLGPEDAGVYPLTISVLNDAGESLDDVHTSLVYYPERPDDPLLFVPVVPLNHVPARAADGTFPQDATTGEWPLERALSDDGWLTGLVGAIRRRVDDGLRVAVAPTPRLLEEVDDMADGYRRTGDGEVDELGPASGPAQDAQAWLDQLRGTLRDRSVQHLLVPYAAPDLPAINEQLDGVAPQIGVGEVITRRVLGLDPAGAWLFAAAGRLDEATLDDIRLTGDTSRTFFAADSLEGSDDPTTGCPGGSPSFACPVSVRSEVGRTRGYVSDSMLQTHLGALGRDEDRVVALQRFFAETAMIREELPAVPDRIVQATLPSLWHPSARTSARLFEGLATAPWLETVTPQQGLREREPATRRVVGELPAPSLGPTQSYYEAVRASEEKVEQFASIQPPPDLRARLHRNLLVAASRSWWIDRVHLDRGLGYAIDAATEADDQLDEIVITGRDEITLTSRQGPVSFVVSNGTDYRVTLEFRLSSPQLRFEQDSFREVIPPGNEIIPLQATARSSGTFPMEASVQTPLGEEITSTRIDIRSTELNRIALALTIGALLFVIAFYVGRGMQKRRTRGRPAEAPAA